MHVTPEPAVTENLQPYRQNRQSLHGASARELPKKSSDDISAKYESNKGAGIEVACERIRGVMAGALTEKEGRERTPP